MYLSLPLPMDKSEINVVYVPYLPSQKQLKLTIQIEKDANIGQLKEEVEKSIASIQHVYSASILFFLLSEM
jgi:hypothetical protein